MGATPDVWADWCRPCGGPVGFGRCERCVEFTSTRLSDFDLIQLLTFFASHLNRTGSALNTDTLIHAARRIAAYNGLVNGGVYGKSDG